MFAGVLVVGLIGALIARFRPQGMSYALVATAIAQAVVGVIVLVVPITALKLIAMEVGFGSESALSRSFKANCGVSPREWKQAL